MYYIITNCPKSLCVGLLPVKLLEIIIFSQLINAVETDNMDSWSENSDLEEKKTLSENLSVNIGTDQELLEDIFEESKSIHDTAKVEKYVFKEPAANNNDVSGEASCFFDRNF